MIFAKETLKHRELDRYISMELLGGSAMVDVECRVGTVFGYVMKSESENESRLTLPGREPGCHTTIGAGTAFCFSVDGRNDKSAHLSGRAWFIQHYGQSFPTRTSVVESRGRLSYIDGCSDTVLISPPRNGDPCLNHLHFPCGINQSWHTHPSIRLGLVISGAGVAYFMDEQGAKVEKALEVGMMFMITPHTFHRFCTPDSPMDIIAYHPDSSGGPTDHNHPMMNRTYVDQNTQKEDSR